VPVSWDEQHIGTTVDPRTNSMVTRENLDSVLKHGIGLKGPMATPIGKGHRSLNLTLRKELQLYANVRPCFSIPGYKTRYDDVNLVTIRENTEGKELCISPFRFFLFVSSVERSRGSRKEKRERAKLDFIFLFIIIFSPLPTTPGEYSGLEHEVVPGVVESLKVITRAASTRVVRFFFSFSSLFFFLSFEVLRKGKTHPFLTFKNASFEQPQAEYAFKYARDNGRARVTAIHKANIMKLADGLFIKVREKKNKEERKQREERAPVVEFLFSLKRGFFSLPSFLSLSKPTLQCCREVHEKYPDIVYDEMIVDNACMQLVKNPNQFDVLVRYNVFNLFSLFLSFFLSFPSFFHLLSLSPPLR
jgi:isocitrate dehydrogenase (NAD+)